MQLWEKLWSQDRSAGHVNAAILLMDIHYVLWTRAVNRDYSSVQVRCTAFLLVLTHASGVYHGIPSPEIPTKHLDGFRLCTEPDQWWCLGTEQLEMRQKLRDSQKKSFERCQAQGESLNLFSLIAVSFVCNTDWDKGQASACTEDVYNKKGNYSCGSQNYKEFMFLIENGKLSFAY